MAKVHIVVSRTNAQADSGATLPVPDAVPAQVATITSTPASAIAQTFQPQVAPLVCHLTAIGGPIWAAFGDLTGDDPVAGEGAGWLVQDGETRSVGLSGRGQRVAIKDAVL